MRILGIETSCDETAAAVVEDGRKILSNAVYSQIRQHAEHGGVVPEIASRCHVEVLPGILEEAVGSANLAWSDVDAIAVTYGPGLASSLLIGMQAAKSLAARLDKPLFGVNHLQGHLFSVFLDETAPSPEAVFPMLVLLVSGGHSCLVLEKNIGECTLLGQTLDDAAGEAFDKGATMMGLGYPGGPAIEKAAAGGDPLAVRFPRGLKRGGQVSGRELCFSFSGVKTSLLYHLQKYPDSLHAATLPDVAASYQQAIVDALLDKLERAVQQHSAIKTVACVGGVAKNRALRMGLDEMARRYSLQLLTAPLRFCTDNAAMIAGVAWHQQAVDQPVQIDMDVQPNLTVDRFCAGNQDLV